MAKLGTRYYELKAHTLKLLEDLRDKITSEEVELIKIQKEGVIETGANPGEAVMNYSPTGEIIFTIRYVNHKIRSEHEDKTASWMPSTRQVINR